MGIPTLGNLNSWDNAWKGLKVRPALLTCWSENNKLELCRMASYRLEQVQVIGVPAFDAYFAPDGQWSRAELCARLGLDANRPLLLFATLGQFKQQIDETNPLEVLLKAIDAGAIPGNPQVVARLHPWSRETYFKPLLQHPAVSVSRYEHYVPGLTWTPTRDEAILAGNLLRHANLVISPGSTMVVEAAIFDTPVVVPVFNEYMPEIFENYFRQTWLNQHFGSIYRNDWAPLVKQPAEMVSAINAALNNPGWYREGSRQIRENILGPLDGKATRRFAEAILGAVGK
jgi:glycosyltransferase involved in cell wall biosynthesis